LANITKTLVDGLKASSVQAFIWDDRLHGFGVRVSPAGVKSFVIQYRPRDSRKASRLTIGRYGKITTEQARTEATKLLARVTLGDDPATERQTLRKASMVKPMTVADLMDRFVTGHVMVNNKPRTQVEEIRLINRLVRPKIGKMPLHELTRGEVKKWHSGITSAKISANRALAHLKRACRFGIEHEWMIENPCTNITRNKETPRDRYFSDDELKRIGGAIRELAHEKRILPSVADGFWLLALTGMRAGEVRGLRWTDFDHVQKVLRLSDAKAGARMVPLFSEALTLLNGMTRHGPFIVTGPKPETEIGEYYLIDAMRSVLDRAKVSDGSMHVFRHTLASYMAQNGQDVWAISRMGGWKTLAMVQRYVSHHSVGEKHPLPAGQRIAMALSGGNVVSLVKSA
jgi:integrase